MDNNQLIYNDLISTVNTYVKEIDRLRDKNKKLNAKIRAMKRKYDKLDSYHKKVMSAISCLPFSIDEFIKD